MGLIELPTKEELNEEMEAMDVNWMNEEDDDQEDDDHKCTGIEELMIILTSLVNIFTQFLNTTRRLNF